MKPRAQVWVSGVNTISPTPFPVAGEANGMEMMLYLQIREARLPGKGGGGGGRRASLGQPLLQVCVHLAASWNLPSYTWAGGCPSSLG